MASDEQRDRILRELARQGGAGNIKLRQALGWDDAAHGTVRDVLLTDGVITREVGRGGSVRLVGTVSTPAPGTASAPLPTSKPVREASFAAEPTPARPPRPKPPQASPRPRTATARTGFDAPSMHTMFVDKPTKGHGLIQAIARVNRVFRDKPTGLVVDYIGIAQNLKNALGQYLASDHARRASTRTARHAARAAGHDGRGHRMDSGPPARSRSSGKG